MAKRRKNKPRERTDDEKFPYDWRRLCPFCGNTFWGLGGIWSRRWIAGPPCCDRIDIHVHMGCCRCKARWITGVWLKKDGPPHRAVPTDPASG